MEKVLLIKSVYSQAFKNLGHQIVKHGFKVYFWVFVALYAIVLYAFSYRILTGFAWD